MWFLWWVLTNLLPVMLTNILDGIPDGRMFTTWNEEGCTRGPVAHRLHCGMVGNAAGCPERAGRGLRWFAISDDRREEICEVSCNQIILIQSLIRQDCSIQYWQNDLPDVFSHSYAIWWQMHFRPYLPTQSRRRICLVHGKGSKKILVKKRSLTEDIANCGQGG